MLQFFVAELYVCVSCNQKDRGHGKTIGGFRERSIHEVDDDSGFISLICDGATVIGEVPATAVTAVSKASVVTGRR